MILKAFPKINLCLKVYKRERNELKHRIDSIFYLYKKIHDTIFIKKAKIISIKYKGNEHSISSNNCIISKTLNYLHDKYKWDINYQIIIKKRIPIGAGLGGASSDAAAIINFFISLHKDIFLDLKEIALNLGSDIPFFLTQNKISRVKNYGEFVAPIYNWKPKFKLTLNDIYIPTVKIFNALDEDKSYKSKVDVDIILKTKLNKLNNVITIYNDLTKYIINYNRSLGLLLKNNVNNISFFSGSGSAIIKMKD